MSLMDLFIYVELSENKNKSWYVFGFDIGQAAELVATSFDKPTFFQSWLLVCIMWKQWNEGLEISSFFIYEIP